MNRKALHIAGILLQVMALATTGCTSRSVAGEQAGKGAGYGAFTGAVSGFFWGLLRGNPLRGATEGAFVGGATGAVVGGVHGAGADRELKAEYGDVNYKALMALVRRNYPEARKYAAQTADDPDPNHRHASAWLSALIVKETLGRDALDSCYDKLIELDNDIDTREDARVEVRLAERDLKSLRRQLGVR